MSRARILVVDDDEAILDSLRRALEVEGYAVRTAVDGAGALSLVAQNEPDAVVLDIGLPDLNGWIVAARMRAGGLSTPILVLSALDQVDDRIAGLEAGADDYLVKPFAIAELVARLRALLRRAATHSEGGGASLQPPVRLGPLLVDVEGAAASWDGRDLGLTGRELALLDALARNAEAVLGRDRLLEMVWGYDFAPDSRALDVFMTYLRRKLVFAARTRHPELAIDSDLPVSGPLVEGDADGLWRVVENLLENAARHGRPDAHVRLRVAANGAGAEIVVEDDGPGIPVAERQRVVRRFARGRGATAAGSGLARDRRCRSPAAQRHSHAVLLRARRAARAGHDRGHAQALGIF